MASIEKTITAAIEVVPADCPQPFCDVEVWISAGLGFSPSNNDLQCAATALSGMRRWSLFEGYTDLRWTAAGSEAEALRPNRKDRFDVVVLHDSHDNIGEKERAALRAFVESGKGISRDRRLHILAMVAGARDRRQVPAGQIEIQRRVEVIARPVKAMAKHPVLAGVGPIVVEDEVYKDMRYSPEITVLMETDHPDNDRPVVYIGPPGKWRAVYIQPGHEGTAFRHAGYHRLMHNAIAWTAERG